MSSQSLFGTSKAEIWQQFSAQIGGHYYAGFWSGGKVEATHGPWTIVLDTYAASGDGRSLIYTRIRAPYVNPSGFTFLIYRKDVLSEIAQWLGMRTIIVGFPDLDENFVIKGNDKEKLRQLFANTRIRSLIGAQPGIRLSVLDEDPRFWSATFPENVYELHFRVFGVIKDVDRLKQLYELFAETLEELCRMGSATHDAPGVQI